jgi:hypothetical protein
MHAFLPKKEGVHETRVSSRGASCSGAGHSRDCRDARLRGPAAAQFQLADADHGSLHGSVHCDRGRACCQLRDLPHFSPGSGYDKALQVVLILDVLGTILILLLHRFGPARTDGATGKPEARPSPPPSHTKLPAVP